MDYSLAREVHLFACILTHCLGKLSFVAQDSLGATAAVSLSVVHQPEPPCRLATLVLLSSALKPAEQDAFSLANRCHRVPLLLNLHLGLQSPPLQASHRPIVSFPVVKACGLSKSFIIPKNV